MVVLGDAVDDELANDVIARLVFLEHSSRDLTLCIARWFSDGLPRARRGHAPTEVSRLDDVHWRCVGQGKRFALRGAPDEFNKVEAALMRTFAEATGVS